MTTSVDPSKKPGANRLTLWLHEFGLSKRDAILCTAALLCAVFLGAWGFTNHAFWDDEASTALFARNLLATGELTAWDGVNLIGYRLGAQLDESLQNPYAPPLQYYIAAAGFYLFGETTFGGRILFLILGILALPALMLWTRRHFDGRVPLWLPALIAALSPAFLLFIRQCRYFAPAMLFTLCLLAAWSWTGSTRRSRYAVLAAGALSTAGLWYASYLNAVSALAMLPVFFLDGRYRTRQKGVFLGVVLAVSLICGIHIYFAKGPTASQFAPASFITGLDRISALFAQHMVGLGTFEFFPVLLMVVLMVPFAGQRFGRLRRFARQGWAVFLAMIAAILVTALFSPQPVSGAANADMRYIAPLILTGAALTAVCLVILWDLSRPLACLAAILVVMSNVLTLSWVAVPQVPLRSTLLSYLAEGAENYKTGTEALVEAVAALPGGSRVLIFPDYMTYGPMFYVPGQRYCWQLTERKTLQPGLRETLPDYLFVERARPDFILTGPVAPESLIARFEGKFGKGTYRLRGYLQGDWRDCSRPEIPLHCFGPPPPRPDQRGIAVIEATGR
jgi:4-amino-4-deoxy-L-arabinose transferase-like glycosyltransferase